MDKDKALAAYQKAINQMDDLLEYRRVFISRGEFNTIVTQLNKDLLAAAQREG